MARKGEQALQSVKDVALERMTVSAVSRVGPLVPPWLLLGTEAIGAAVSHAAWGGPGSVAWAAIGCTLGSTVLTGLTWLVSHHRRLLGRVHSTMTTAAASGWFTIATVTGVGADATAGMLFYGGVTLALSWNIRGVIRIHAGDGGHGGDPLAALFDRAKDRAGLKGARVRTTEVTDHKIKGVLQLPPGEMTSSDAQRAKDRLESGMQLPPGSVVITADEDRADRANVSFSDARTIKQPILWPGPSHPGESIDKPLRVGIYQDGDPAEYRLVGQHVQIMGMTGSGKSIGGAWNLVGELMTRNDAAVFSIDISKDDQTMGPLRAGLHRFETTKAGAVALIREIHEEIPKRTKWLADRGFRDWEPGCGLTYWILHLEEVAKVFAELDSRDTERLEEILKELRSAGGSVVYSLQRATFDQIPTIVRSQAAKWCFGVADPDDTKYGVSARQRKAEAAPHEWESLYPGMSLLDGKSVRSTHYAMPLRTFSWGADSREANAAMLAHAAAHPAAARNVDEFTARISRPAIAGADQAPAVGRGQEETEEAHDVEDFERAEFLGEFAELLADAAGLVIQTQYASAAMLTRKLRLPHADVLQLLEALERKGAVGPASETGDRPVLIPAGSEAAAQLVDELRQHGDVVTAALRTDDPDPRVTAGPDDTIQAPPDEDTEGLETDEDQTDELDADQARALVCQWLRERMAAGNTPFAVSDPGLVSVRQQAGKSRPWVYEVLRELTATGVLAENRASGRKVWKVADLPPVDGGQAAA